MAEDEEDEDEANEELGGLFHVSRPDKESKRKADALDCSKFAVETPQDWDLEEVLPLETDGLVCSWNCVYWGSPACGLLESLGGSRKQIAGELQKSIDVHLPGM